MSNQYENTYNKKAILQIIPEPLELIIEEGYYKLTENININIDSNFYESVNDVQFLQDFLETEGFYTNIIFDKNYDINNHTSNIFIIKDTTLINNEEYSVIINKKGIILKANHLNGLFYAIQTFAQIMLSGKINEKLNLPFTSIHDKPQFELRTLMLDPARNFISIANLERFIDIMAMYKFNQLHLNLADNESWRIEIESLPQLTQTLSKQKNVDNKYSYYTQNQLKYIVNYAQERHIEIIPQINFPAHSIAILSVFPQLSCTQKLVSIDNKKEYSKEILCAGNNLVYDFIEIIIEELATIFPSKYFHIGGGSVMLDNWKKCRKCQSVIKKNQLKSENELLSYFYQRIDSLLIINNKEPMQWYNINIIKYPINSILYLSDFDLSKEVLADKSYKFVLSPEKYTFLDRPQWKGDIPDNYQTNILTLEQTYNFEPTLKVSNNLISNIIGIEACLWGYYIKNIERILYMTWPRALAISEIAWSSDKNRNWSNFKTKLDLHLNILLKQGVNYRVPAELFINF